MVDRQIEFFKEVDRVSLKLTISESAIDIVKDAVPQI